MSGMGASVKTFEAIACRVSMSDAGVVSYHIVEDPREVNHWVACVDQGGRHGDGAEADDEETLTFPRDLLILQQDRDMDGL